MMPPGAAGRKIVIYVIIRIASSNAAPGPKALWIVLVLLLPVLGVILWFLLGPKR
jgi:hypothetical protein